MKWIQRAARAACLVCAMSFAWLHQSSAFADNESVIPNLKVEDGYPEDTPIKLAVEEFNLRTKKTRDLLEIPELTESELFAALKIVSVRRGDVSKKDAANVAKLADVGKVPKGSMLRIVHATSFENENGKPGTWNIEMGNIYLHINLPAATPGKAEF